MRLGLEAGPHTHDLAVELGIYGVPISAEQLVNHGADATLTSLAGRGLNVCQIGAFGYNPLSPDKERQAQQHTLVERAIPLAAATGCPYIVINGGNYHPSGFGAGDGRNFTPAALEEIAHALRPLLALAEAYGVKLSIEPYLKTAIHSPERFLALRELVGSAALCANIDPSSLYDYQDLWTPQGKVQHVCCALAGHYGLVHIKEVALAEGFHIHAGLAPLGAGQTDWAEMLRLVEPHLPPDSWVILEHVQTPDEARSSVTLLRAAALQAGVTLE